MAPSEAEVGKAFSDAISKAGCTVEDDICEYLAGSCHAVLEDDDGSDQSSLESTLKEAIEAQLEDAGANDKQIASICAAIAALKLGGASTPAQKTATAAVAKSKPKEAAKTANGDDLMCCVQDLLLMYGGSSKALLTHTTFELRRLHRYGIVGHNGAGKTTLMTALVAGAVKELPSDLVLVHVHGGSVAELDDEDTSALQYASSMHKEISKAGGKSGPTAAEVLAGVGFGAEMQSKMLGQLSGGWRMRLVLACAMMKHADVLLLDEPTNHLDTAAVQWLGDYLQGFKGTSLIISHEPEFLNKVCTDIIHFDQQKLKYYEGNFAAFQEQASIHGDEADKVLETKSWSSAAKAIQGAQGEVKLSFPIPGKLDGVTTQTKPILEVKKCSFGYTGEGNPVILKHVSCKLSLGSRVAVVGANGAGKSTLLSLMCGEVAPIEYEGTLGEVDRHRNCRLSYIAQHHTFHLEAFLKCTPVHYFQLRFRNGYDEQLQIRLIEPATEEERQLRAELASKHGKYGKAVRDIVGRQKRGKEIYYEIAWEGLDDAKQNTFEPMSKLRLMHVDGLARAFDERMAAQAAGTHSRPLTEREIIKHMESFNYTEEMCTRQMLSTFSAGQKSRLMLGAAFWTKPHVISLDEPTNYLDPETVDALAKALKNFRGGVIAVTHSEHFINEVCNERWEVKEGVITASKFESEVQKAEKAAASAKATLEAKPAEPEPVKPVSAAAAALQKSKNKK